MSWEALFEFFADNPPSIAIAGGVLMIMMSVFTAPFDVSTTGFLRAAGILFMLIGFILQVLWLFRESL